MSKKRIAITGGIGSGKSTAVLSLRNMGYSVFSCDDIYKEILSSEEYLKKLEEYFPEVIINHQVDKRRLSDLVFNNEEKRKLLNGISHPLVMARLNEYMNEAQGELVFAEVPLLFEGNFEHSFDCILVIVRDLQNRIRSVVERDKLNPKDVQKRIDAQFDYFSKDGIERMKNCNAHIIENNGNLEDLSKQLKVFLSAL